MVRRFPLACALLLLAVSAAAQTADDLVLVDCRLPPKQRRIGNRTYPMASRPIRTTGKSGVASSSNNFERPIPRAFAASSGRSSS